jgi:signal transduction histidine kinase
LQRNRQGVIDALLAATAVAVALVSAASQGGGARTPYRPLDPIGVVLILLQGLPLALRQRYPLAVWGIIGLSITAYYLVGYPPTFAGGTLIALFTVALKTGRATAILAGLATGGAVAVSLASLSARGGIAPDQLVGSIAVDYLVYATAWLLGDNVRVRRAYTAELEARLALFDRERAQSDLLAVSEERARIARELHDIVAHNVSVMVVQASAARRVLRSTPDEAARALEAITATGRQALGELRGMLGVLRSGDGSDVRNPQPSLDGLARLLEQVREVGLDVDLVVEGPRRALPPAIDLSAFRVIQEALTNTLKHAGQARASVRVRYSDREVEVEVVDNGRGAVGALHAGDHQPGQGLIGMRERVALFNGQLSVGPRPTGGYAVKARFPLEPGGV